MNRRQILQGIGAVATTPMIPHAAFAGARPAAPSLMARAAQWAGMWENSSAAMLKHQFQLDDRTAARLFDRLVDGGIIAPPDARGMSQVVMKTFKNPLSAAQINALAQTRPAAPTQPSIQPANTAPPPRPNHPAPRQQISTNRPLDILQDDSQPDPAEATLHDAENTDTSQETQINE